MAVAKAGFSRRGFLKGAGALVVGFSLPGTVGTSLAQVAGIVSGPPKGATLGSWLAVDDVGNVTVFTGKVDLGMGFSTGLVQIVAEELDVEPARIEVVMGDTALTVDQGGTGASTSISLGARPLRNAAAEARHLLLERAAVRLHAPEDQLVVARGIVSVKDNPAKTVSYGALVADERLSEHLDSHGKGYFINLTGTAKPKPTSQYKIVGRSLRRIDVAPKALGSFKFVVDVRVPGMLHGRVIRPEGAGASLLGVDHSSIAAIPGIVDVVTKDNFVGVVAKTEWAAIQGAAKLKVNWSEPQAHFPKMSDLYAHMTGTPPHATKDGIKQGDIEAALAQASQRAEATYQWPFQSHATMGPGCAVADVRKDGRTTLWTGAQKPHLLRKSVAELLRVAPEKLHVIWLEDSGSYGRPGFADCAADAALLSQAIGRPVRVQWMRADMTRWGAKPPAVVIKLRGGVNSQHRIAALDFESWAFSGKEIHPYYDRAGDLLAGQLTGFANVSAADEFAEYGSNSPAYIAPATRAIAHTVPTLYPVGSPLRTTHMRDPEGPQTTFAVESFIDELAALAGIDAVDFRLHHLDDPRSIEVIKTAAARAGWHSRPSPRRDTGGATVVTGRGIAFSPRTVNGPFPPTYVATVAEVEVNRSSGAVVVRKLVCAHDCGLVINPAALKGTIEANLVQSMSRAMKEELRFDANNVTSIDWHTYPIVMAPEVPSQIDVVLIDRPDKDAGGAGEPSSRLTAAALGNAIFDATGARVRTVPMTPQQVKAALAQI